MIGKKILPLWVEVTNEEGTVFILDPVKESDKVKSAKSNGLSVVLLYPESKEKEWVGLTDHEMLMIYMQPHEGFKYSLGRMVEAKLKEKNEI